MMSIFIYIIYNIYKYRSIFLGVGKAFGELQHCNAQQSERKTKLAWALPSASAGRRQSTRSKIFGRPKKIEKSWAKIRRPQ
jgi:hypothetical protein